MSDTKDLTPGTVSWPPVYPTNPIYPGNPPPGWTGGAPPDWCRPPTSVWPPCPPQPCPPPGPWPAGLYRFNHCYDEAQQFKTLVAQVMTEILAENPAMIAVGQPIVGVTNGTDAQPGMVGEFKLTWTTFNWSTGAQFDSLISVGSLPPGDWDCWWYFGLTAPIFGAQIYLEPQPPGFTGDMDQVLYVPGQATPDTFFLNSPHVRALTSVATPLTMRTIIEPGPANGGGGIAFNARRMR